MFIVHLFTIAEIWKQSKHSSMDEWIKSIYCTLYIYTMLCELMCHLDLNKAGRKKRNCYIYIFAFVVQLLGCVQIFVALWSVAHQIPLFMDFPRQEYWSGLLFPSPGDLSHPEIKPTILQVDSLPLSHQRSPYICVYICIYIIWILFKLRKGDLAIKYIEAENRTAVTRCGRVGEMGRCWLKGTKFQVCRMDASERVSS